MAQVKALAYTYGWMMHHSQPSLTRTGRYITTGSAGFPDLVLAHSERGLIFAELKTDTGRISTQQIEWLRECDSHVECYIWRPRDLPEIQARLGRTIDKRSG